MMSKDKDGKMNLLRRRQVPHDVEGKRQELLRRQDVRASAAGA